MSICAAMNSGKNAMFTTSAMIMYDAIASSFLVRLCGCSPYASWLHSSFRMRVHHRRHRHGDAQVHHPQNLVVPVLPLQNEPSPSASSLYAAKPFSLQ